MSRTELNRLNDHDLLVLLHERLSAHIEQHRSGTLAFRWTVVAILTALGVLVGSASVIASLSSP